MSKIKSVDESQSELPLSATSPQEPEKIAALTEGLNAAQQEAVLYGSGPLLVVAGAGTGKTTVLTRRIAYLILSKQALPSEILALTFTDKSAQEMAERVDRILPYGFNDATIATFHAFGDRILRDHAFDAGLSPNLEVMTQPEATIFLKERLFDFPLHHYRPLHDPTRFIAALLNVFSRAKDEEISVQEFLDFAQKRMQAAQSKEEQEEAEKLSEVARAYQFYEELKTQSGRIDFGDQVTLVLGILRRHPDVARALSERYKYILVDEFQDTNYAQFELLKLIAGERANITVVGDDDQSIYKFRGACLSNILSFQKIYPSSRQISLTENYRSTQPILDAAYRLIQHNNPNRLEVQSGLSKALKAQHTEGKAPEFLHFETQFDESEFVAETIEQRLKEGHKPGEFAILVRVNSHADPFIKSLALRGIPWRFSGAAGLFETDEIRMVLAFLRTLDQPADSASLYFLSLSELYALPAEELATLSEMANLSHTPLWELYQKLLRDSGTLNIKNPRDNSERVVIFSEDCIKKLECLVADITRFRQLASKMGTGQMLYQFLESSGVFRRLAESKDVRALVEAENLREFFDLIKKFQQVALYDRAHHFLQHLEALRTSGEDPAGSEAAIDEDAVSVLTVHSAKGLEFPVVFMVSLEQGHFPQNRRGDKMELPRELAREILTEGDYHREEERRLFYVGMTRAKEELYLCTSRDLGGKKMWKPSQFIAEALDQPSVATQKTRKPGALESLRIFAPREMELPLETPPVHESVTISPTSVEDYLSCPLKYRFGRVLRIPVPAHHTQVFGTAVHEALRGLGVAKQEDRTLPLDDFLALFKAHWKSEGFLSREHEEKRFQEGIKMLKALYKRETASPQKPLWVEESFRIEIGPGILRGRFDRVDETPEGAVIIDYKTKAVEDEDKADETAKKSLQLLIYAMAYESRMGKLPKQMELHFVMSGAVGIAYPTEKKLSQARESLLTAVEGIRHNQFDAHPGQACRYCAYEKICPAPDKG